jgi:hypothetical protein
MRVQSPARMLGLLGTNIPSYVARLVNALGTFRLPGYLLYDQSCVAFPSKAVSDVSPTVSQLKPC